MQYTTLSTVSPHKGRLESSIAVRHSPTAARCSPARRHRSLRLLARRPPSLTARRRSLARLSLLTAARRSLRLLVLRRSHAARSPLAAIRCSPLTGRSPPFARRSLLAAGRRWPCRRQRYGCYAAAAADTAAAIVTAALQRGRSWPEVSHGTKARGRSRTEGFSVYTLPPPGPGPPFLPAGS